MFTDALKVNNLLINICLKPGVPSCNTFVEVDLTNGFAIILYISGSAEPIKEILSNHKENSVCKNKSIIQ